MRRLAVLGSTGSIGTATLDVASRFPERFGIVALAAGHNLSLLQQQIHSHRPALVAVADAHDASALAADNPGLTVLAGEEGRVAVATHQGADTVVGAFVGALGLVPTLRALEQGRTVLLANKETLVMAGELVMATARRHSAVILPVDSEHNALHQALHAGDHGSVKRLILTASGGPFRNASIQEMERVTVSQALAHPTWTMGSKITIDSATMMNKGLEIIEAHHLFAVEESRIAVVVHPESRVHSLVEFIDGTLMAQLSVNDMRFPILYALAYPERLPSPFGSLDLVAVGSLHFQAADEERFPCLRLARQALCTGGVAPTTLNAANEVAVAAFLSGELGFLDIARVVEGALERSSPEAGSADSLDGILAADCRAREWARESIGKYGGRHGSCQALNVVVK